MRRLMVAALFTVAVGTIGAAPADAYCDPKYRPLCLNDCIIQNPLGACPR